MAIINLSGYRTTMTNIAISGADGSGKTALAMSLANEFVKENSCSIIVFTDDLDKWAKFCDDTKTCEIYKATETPLNSIRDFFDNNVSTGISHNTLVVLDCSYNEEYDVETVYMLEKWKRCCWERNNYLILVTNKVTLFNTAGIITQAIKSLGGESMYEYVVRKNGARAVKSIDMSSIRQCYQ